MLKRLNLSKSQGNQKKDVITVGGLDNSRVKSNKSKFNINWKIIVRILLGLGIFLILLLVLLYFLVVRPVLNIVYESKAVKDKYFVVKQGVEEQNFNKVKQGLTDARSQLNKFKQSYDSNTSLLKSIPFVKVYLDDANKMILATEESTDLGLLVVDILEPYAKDIGFSVDGSKPKEVSSQERVVQLIRLMPQFSPKVKEISERVMAIDSQLSQIDASRYPTKLPGFVNIFGVNPNLNLQDQILTVQSLSREVSQKSPQFEALFNSLPEFMGLNKPKKYLLIMANNNELRTTGGFNTYVAVAQLSEGIPTILMSMDTYFIDEGDRLRSSALVNRNVCAHLSKYLYIQGRKQRLYARDATSCEVDFVPASDKLVNEFWKKDRTLPQDIDGVIQITNEVIVDLLRVLGPVKTDAYSVVTDQKTRISIPITEFNADNVVNELTNIAGGKLAETIGRKDIIKFLASSILEKIFTSEASNLPNVGKIILESLSKKDVILRSYDPTIQKAFEDLGYAGRIKPVEESADYLYVNRSNFGSGKADWNKEGFVHEEVEKSVREENGKKIGTIKVKIINPKRPEWFNIDPCCFYNAYLRLYVPKGSKLISATASDDQDPKSAEFIDEASGKTYFETFTNQKKETDLTVTFEYELPDTVDLNNYKLYIQRQPGTSIDKYKISAKNTTKEVLLNADKTVIF